MLRSTSASSTKPSKTLCRESCIHFKGRGLYVTHTVSDSDNSEASDAVGAHLPNIDPLLDHAPADAPFDVTGVPEHMQADDAYAQTLIDEAILRSTRPDAADPDYEAEFRATAIQPVNLTTLKTWFEQKNHRAAINLLRQRSPIIINPNLCLSTTDDHVIPSIQGHFVDFVLYLGARLGLDAILPSSLVQHDHTWHINITFSNLFKQWPSTHSQLPFSTTGRMLYLGSRAQEEIWLAFVPNSLLEQPNAPPDMSLLTNAAGLGPASTSSSTSLSADHAYMIVMFFSYLLSEMHLQDIHCNERYPDPISYLSIARVTDILGRLDERNRRLQLTLDDARVLHRQVALCWAEWIHAAPRSWKSDGFLANNSPVALTVRYGQNQPICSSQLDQDAVHMEQLTWDLDHDLTHIRLMSFSLAHHVLFRQVQDWKNISGRILHQLYDELYDLPSTDPQRDRVDLRHRRNGHEFPVYDVDGFRVRRRLPRTFSESGALADLTKIDALFPPDDNGKNTYHAYPLAFTKQFGNVQAKRTLSCFDHVLRDINTALSPAVNQDDQHDYLFGDDVDRGAAVVSGTHAQIYNAMSHRVRDQARFHYVQLGLATSVICGTTAKTTATKRRFTYRKQHCQNGLPHQRFASALRGDDQPQALRIEQTFSIDVRRLRDEHKNGTTVYTEVIAKVCKRLAHPTVIDPIKECIQPFKREVIPNLINWTTYPITSLIELLWKQHLPDMVLGHTVNPYHIEFMSMLERSLNYAHTGSGKVVSRKLMLPYFMSLGILHDGIPCLNKRLVAFTDLMSNKLVVDTNFWPRIPHNRHPLMGSNRVQELTYGKPHMHQSIARFVILDAIEHPSAVPVSINHTHDGRDPYFFNNSLLDHIFEVALQVYIDDVKKLVQMAIEDELRLLANGRDFAARNIARSRKVSLKTWLNCKNPLSYEKDDFPHLLAALDPARLNNGLPFSLDAPPGEGRPVSYFVGKIVDMSTKRREPPFIQDGMFQHIVAAAMEVLCKMTSRHHYLGHDTNTNKFKASISRVVTKMKINHIPWSISNPDPHASGRPSTRVVHTVWLPLGAAEPSRLDQTTLVLTAPQTRNAEVMLSSDQIALKDPRASWSACHHRITNYHKILHKRSLPSEWAIRQASIQARDTFGLEVYQWVEANCDLTNNPLHAIALFIAHIFAGVIPNVFPPRTLGALKDSTPTQLANYVANLPWEERREKKGASQSPPFITMVSTFIIAIMDVRSPMATALNVVHFGKPTDKQKDDVRSFYDKHSNKGISLMNTILRFRLATPDTTKVSKGARWRLDMTLIPPEEICAKWNRIKQCLKEDSAYGSYDAIVGLAGDHTAKTLLTNQWVKTRGRIQVARDGQQTLGRRRHVDDLPSSDDLVVLPYGENQEAGPSRNRRRI
ncbi:hypothetical protein L210DRAFT_865517 [Boletus edulis BED1]|uniref:DUF8190 domain-containing protein n=1 Tax=Boletus edulis BED1 TaxID=1328754 RepID=A0AAD4G8B3_BOLED|nr:hypothetical protein L210DRAFT_865517 [Boletus edulis BED1]